MLETRAGNNEMSKTYIESWVFNVYTLFFFHSHNTFFTGEVHENRSSTLFKEIKRKQDIGIKYIVYPVQIQAT